MTEEWEDNYLVRVRAQVMTRDDSTGGWVPLSGGGLANVSVRKRVIPVGTSNQCPSVISIDGCGSHSPSTTTKGRHEYLIHGKRPSDQCIVLSCTIKKDFEYNKVMPTFHHWRVGDNKFGLTFQTAADGRAFDEGVRKAVKELLQGLTDVTVHGNIADDEGVFMTLNLPMDAELVRTPSYQSGYSDLPDPQKRIQYIDGTGMKVPPVQDPLGSNTDTGSDSLPYVHLTYMSIMGDQKGEKLEGRSAEGGMKKPAIVAQHSKTPKTNMKRTVRCKHCQELYSQDENPRGACKYAPDPVRRGIDRISCIMCAKCMVYHCMGDTDGDFTHEPCSCAPEERCRRKWCGLALLSFLVPCLWLYPPLRAAHWCGVTCGMCGGRHRPME